jgi:hypothetical protein
VKRRFINSYGIASWEFLEAIRNFIVLDESYRAQKTLDDIRMELMNAGGVMAELAAPVRLRSKKNGATTRRVDG